MNQVEESRYDSALNQIRKQLGGSHESVYRHLVKLDYRVSASTVWRWFTERKLPLNFAVILVELTTEDLQERQRLLKVLLPELKNYLK